MISESEVEEVNGKTGEEHIDGDIEVSSGGDDVQNMTVDEEVVVEVSEDEGGESTAGEIVLGDGDEQGVKRRRVGGAGEPPDVVGRGASAMGMGGQKRKKEDREHEQGEDSKRSRRGRARGRGGRSEWG